MFSGSILALDLASTTGWAFGKPEDSAPTFGHYRFAKPGSPRAIVYREFRTWLAFVLSAYPAELVVYESPALPMIMHGKTNIDTIKLLMGFAEHLEEWAHGKVELREASVGQVRAHFIGHNCKRALARPLTVERCLFNGWQVSTGDEADACALWDYQRHCLRPDIATRLTPLFSGRPEQNSNVRLIDAYRKGLK